MNFFQNLYDHVLTSHHRKHSKNIILFIPKRNFKSSQTSTGHNRTTPAGSSISIPYISAAHTTLRRCEFWKFAREKASTRYGGHPVRRLERYWRVGTANPAKSPLELPLPPPPVSVPVFPRSLTSSFCGKAFVYLPGKRLGTRSTGAIIDESMVFRNDGAAADWWIAIYVFYWRFFRWTGFGTESYFCDG